MLRQAAGIPAACFSFGGRFLLPAGFSFLPGLLHYLLVGSNDVLVHLALHLLLHRRNGNERPHQLHLQNALLLLLGEIVDAVGLVEPVVGLHQTLHDIDEIPEDLHAAYAVEVGRAGQLFLHSKDQTVRQRLEIGGGIPLIGGHAAQVVAPHLAAALHDHAQVALIPVVAADEVGDGGTVGDSAVAVAELPVVKALEAGMGVMVRDGKGIDKGVGGLNGIAQELVKAVLIDALPGDGAAEAPQTPPGKGEVPQIDHPALKGQGRPEIGNHVV